jgi:hypothetical protein
MEKVKSQQPGRRRQEEQSAMILGGDCSKPYAAKCSSSMKGSVEAFSGRTASGKTSVDQFDH